MLAEAPVARSEEVGGLHRVGPAGRLDALRCDGVDAVGGAADAHRVALVDDVMHGTTITVNDLSRRFGLPSGMTRRRAIDTIWVLTAPELYDRLVRQRGWTPDDYEQWLASAMIAALGAA